VQKLESSIRDSGCEKALVSGLTAAEIDAPEVRRGGEKLDADADAALAGVAQINDAAFLFFLGFWADQDEDFALYDFVAQDQQAAMSADDHGFADFAELAAFLAASEGLQLGLVKHPLTAAIAGSDQFCHALIMGPPPKTVNCPKGQLFPDCYPNQISRKLVPLCRWP
jgi:hypothetical protein